MRIVYIHQHFCTNKGTGGTRSYDVARHIVQGEHEIYMITGISESSKVEPMPWYRLFRSENIDGINVIYCNVPYTNHLGVLKRMLAFWWFVVLAAIAAFRVPRPDLIFATSTPLTVGIPGYFAALFKRVPFVFEVRDLWPEAFLISGELKPGPLAWLLRKLEEFLYAKAEKILLVSPGFERRLRQRGYRQEKLKTVLLGADGELFRDAKPNPEFRKKYGLEDKILAIFTGAHGWSNGLDYVLEAAELLKDRDDIKIILLGEGREKPRLKSVAQEKQLNNILFLDAVVKTEMVGIVSACDIGLMILLHVGQPRPVIPNKIFDYMFASLPSIVNFPGCTLEVVEADGTGVGSDPNDPADLAEKIRFFADNPDKRKEMGQRGRQVAYEKYTRQIISGQLLETFEEVLQKHSRS
jgi:glycosyltransferase involved in cell wall biosynthesis